MKFIVDGVVKEVTLRVWNGTQYSSDCFADVCDPGANYEKFDDEGSAIVTADRFDADVNWWHDIIRDANNGVYTEVFGNRSADDGELVLFVEEV